MVSHEGAPLGPFRADAYELTLPPTENTVISLDIALELHNSGAAPVRVLDTSLSCGCMHGELSAETIAPDATASFHLVIEVFRNQERIDHSVMFTTDETDGAYFVKILGELSKPLSGVPSRVTFLRSAPEDEAAPQVSEFTVMENSDRVASVDAPLQGVSLTHERAGDKEVAFRLTLLDPSIEGPRGVAAITTTQGRVYAIPVAVIAPPTSVPLE